MIRLIRGREVTSRLPGWWVFVGVIFSCDWIPVGRDIYVFDRTNNGDTTVVVDTPFSTGFRFVPGKSCMIDTVCDVLGMIKL